MLKNLYAPICKDEEILLIKNWQENRDEKSMESLIKSHLSMIFSIARKTRSVYFDDIVSEGIIGLIIAIEKFDPQKGARLSHYARDYIKFAMQEYIIKNNHIVTFPLGTQGLNIVYGHTEIQEHHIKTPDMEKVLYKNILHKQFIAFVNTVLHNVQEKERDIFESRMLSDDPQNLGTLGEKWSISAERVRQIEKILFLKIKKNWAALH